MEYEDVHDFECGHRGTDEDPEVYISEFGLSFSDDAEGRRWKCESFTPGQMREILFSRDFLSPYLTSDCGTWVTVEASGRVTTRGESETPAAGWDGPYFSVKVPGIGNLDSSEFTEGFVTYDDERDGYVEIDGGRFFPTLADVIEDCIKNGDMSMFVDSLLQRWEEEREEFVVWFEANPNETAPILVE